MAEAARRINPWTKMAIEVGPIAVFFIANNRADIFVATAAFMVAIVASLIANYMIERRVPAFPLVTGVFVLVMGGLTLALQDELFIKLKPTITNLLFSAILLGGLAFGKLFLRHVFGAAFHLNETGWRILTWRWALFFVVLAIANEVVWRNFTTDTWVSFKVFAIAPATFIFAIAQMPVIRRHGHILGDDDAPADNPKAG